MQTDFLLEARRSFELAAQATQQHEMVLYAEIGRKCLALTYAALNTDQPNENSVPLVAKPMEFDFDSIDFSQVHEHLSFPKIISGRIGDEVHRERV